MDGLKETLSSPFYIFYFLVLSSCSYGVVPFSESFLYCYLQVLLPWGKHAWVPPKCSYSAKESIPKHTHKYIIYTNACSVRAHGLSVNTRCTHSNVETCVRMDPGLQNQPVLSHPRFVVGTPVSLRVSVVVHLAVLCSTLCSPACLLTETRHPYGPASSYTSPSLVRILSPTHWEAQLTPV